MFSAISSSPPSSPFTAHYFHLNWQIYLRFLTNRSAFISIYKTICFYHLIYSLLGISLYSFLISFISLIIFVFELSFICPLTVYTALSSSNFSLFISCSSFIIILPLIIINHLILFIIFRFFVIIFLNIVCISRLLLFHHYSFIFLY